MRRPSTRQLAAAVLVGALAALGCGKATQTQLVPGASTKRGHDLIATYGCGACHQIDGVELANGHVGPPLTNFKKRIPFIVGKLPNTPQNLERWIESPQSIAPRSIMPNLGVTPQQARDIAAYLYTQ